MLTEELAEDIGFHLGDGYAGDYSTKANPHKYELTYSGHAIDDKRYFIEMLQNRKLNLFNIKPRITIRNNSIKASILSKALLTYFRDVIGVVCGNKLNAGVPTIIIESNKSIKSAFLRGLFDADGCITFLKKHKDINYYPSIRIGLASKSIIEGIKPMLLEFGIKYTSFSKIPFGHIGKRQSCIDINGKENLEKWINLIGFNNYKHIAKYKIWKAFGFCPPKLNVEQYEKILESKQN